MLRPSGLQLIYKWCNGNACYRTIQRRCSGTFGLYNPAFNTFYTGMPSRLTQQQLSTYGSLATPYNQFLMQWVRHLVSGLVCQVKRKLSYKQGANVLWWMKISPDLTAINGGSRWYNCCSCTSPHASTSGYRHGPGATCRICIRQYAMVVILSPYGCEFSRAG